MKSKLPDSAIQLIHQLAEDEHRSQFGIGDLTAALVDELGVEYGKANLRRDIAQEYRCEVGTIRDREQLARIYTSAVRDEYPTLLYHHWRALRRTGDKWREYASKAVGNADEYGGRPAPVWLVRQWIKDDLQGQPPQERVSRPERLWRLFLDILDEIGHEDTMPGGKSRFARWVLKMASDEHFREVKQIARW